MPEVKKPCCEVSWGSYWETPPHKARVEATHLVWWAAGPGYDAVCFTVCREHATRAKEWRNARVYALVEVI